MSSFDELAARLIERARLLGEAVAAARRAARADPASVWRDPALLWPLLTKE